MARALVFDLDGTLVDSLPGIAASLNRALAGLGLPTHPTAAVRRFIGNGVGMLARRALPDDPPDAQISQLADEFLRDYAANWARGTSPYPGIIQALARLATRAPLAVWSNKPHAFTLETVAALFPEIAFALVLGEREGVPRKPDPASATEITEALGQPAGQITLVGDSITDIESARNAGFRAAAVTWGYHDRDQLATAGPEIWIDSPAGLAALAEDR